MDRFIKDRIIKRRSITISTAVAILALAVTIPIAVAQFSAKPAKQSPPAAQAPHRSTSSVQPSSPIVDTSPQSATVQLATRDVTPSTRLVVSASGFQANEDLVATIKDSKGHSYEHVTLTADNGGKLREVPVTLPSLLAGGTYQVVVVGSTSQRSASATFQMHVLPPTLTLDTYTGKPGQDIGFAGGGFIAGEDVEIYLGNSTTPLASKKATTGGAVDGRVKIPTLPPGTYTFTVVGAVSQTPASVGFNVQGFAPWVILNHYALKPGEHMGFIGHGFAPNEQVLVYLNSVQSKPVMTLKADVSGQVVLQDSWVPDAASGSHSITLVGETSKASATTDFTILQAPEPTPPAATTP